ncbi:hypothetical protein ACFFMN_32770 [Planobispora siamensis]|uniref:Uncharacterized protein n=1 Tax=Planobispora siamensis TaxID=936338 RepID=A0A8J3WJV5_9ACTN|nr:hypothetical protein [Planobispora siamensis]GIH91067.1 hypothetical protein Psi01_16970 [Planobispora siamensis]
MGDDHFAAGRHPGLVRVSSDDEKERLPAVAYPPVVARMRSSDGVGMLAACCGRCAAWFAVRRSSALGSTAVFGVAPFGGASLGQVVLGEDVDEQSHRQIGLGRMTKAALDIEGVVVAPADDRR